MDIATTRIEFPGADGGMLAARLDSPAGTARAYAIFAHCFTCSKDLNATRRISAELARLGIAVLRFDFTGLGSSEGEFANTNFSSNVSDLVKAAEWLTENRQAPQLLIGHSLGGAAVLAAAPHLKELRAVVTIGAPADAGHVVENFAADLATIREQGSAEVTLGGRTFTIRKQFLDDLEQSRVTERLADLGKALLILHSPTDDVVGIENAAEIYTAARHPKNFISLDGADHLLTQESDAMFAAGMIAAWVTRYLDADPAQDVADTNNDVVARETGNGKFQNSVRVRGHRMIADEPKSVGGMDTGPTPYDFVAIGLAACTSMTLRMYADRKKWQLGAITVHVDHAKIHAADCEECTSEERAAGGRIDRFHRTLSIEGGGIEEDMREKLLEIADKCPVHRTLEAQAKIATSFKA